MSNAQEMIDQVVEGADPSKAISKSMITLGGVTFPKMILKRVSGQYHVLDADGETVGYLHWNKNKAPFGHDIKGWIRFKDPKLNTDNNGHSYTITSTDTNTGNVLGYTDFRTVKQNISLLVQYAKDTASRKGNNLRHFT
jgi:hypothetical protein